MGIFQGAKKPPVAGSTSSVVEPKSPAYRGAGSSGYKPEENVNGGMGGGKKGKVSPFHGQSSDGSGEKNDLVPQTVGQKDPYQARGSDFSVTRATAGNGQSGAGEAGFSSGHNELARYSTGQESPRTMEDDGMGDHGSGTPVPGNRAGRIASVFSVGVSDGESNSDTGEIGISESVNLQTGHVEGSGSRSGVDEVPESKVSIGSASSSVNRKAGLKGKNY